MGEHPYDTGQGPDTIRRVTARRRALESYNTTKLGVIALVMVGILVAGALSFRVFSIGYTHYTAEFAQAAALKPGNAITVAGIEVGHVSSMRLAGDHVAAGIRVRNDVRLGRATQAVIKVMSILGSRYLELIPAGSDPLPDKTIRLSHTQVPYDLQELLGDAVTTFDTVDSDQFAESLAVLGRQLEGLPPILPRAMENLHTLAKITGDRRDQLGTLLAGSQRLINTLRKQQSDIGNLIDRGQNLISELVARRDTFHAMLAALTDLVGSMDDLVVNNRQMFDATLSDLRELADMLGQHDDLLRSIIESAPPALRGLTNATGWGPAVEFYPGNGIAVDSWMCAISGRAKQFGMIEYFKDCK